MSSLVKATDANIRRLVKKSASGESLYLASNLVQPGDVLLTAGVGKFSEMIKSLTEGPFSHAAVVQTEFRLVEALDDGIGPTHLTLERIESREGKDFF